MKATLSVDGAMRMTFRLQYRIDVNTVKLAIAGLLDLDEAVTSRRSIIERIARELFLSGDTWVGYGWEKWTDIDSEDPRLEELARKFFPDLYEMPKCSRCGAVDAKTRIRGTTKYLCPECVALRSRK